VPYESNRATVNVNELVYSNLLLLEALVELLDEKG
jgi:hypothetical protein